MPDFLKPFNERDVPANGIGPYTTGDGEIPEVPAIGAGEIVVGFNMRTFKKGKYHALSPRGFNEAEFTNLDTDNGISVVINDGATTRYVPASSSRTIKQSGMFRFEVRNIGASEIAKDDVKLTMMHGGIDADERARSQATRSPLERVISNFTGL